MTRLLRRPTLLALLAVGLLGCEDVRHEGRTPAEWAVELQTVAPHQRARAVAALNDHLWPYAASAVPALLPALDAEDDDLRRLAARCLGRIGDGARAAVPRLVERFAKEESPLACAIALALGEIGDERALPALRKALADEAPTVRACAAQALGRFGPAAKGAEGELEGLLADKALLTRLRAAVALVQITGGLDGARPVIDDALHPPAGPVSRARIYAREAAIQAIGEIGPPAGAFAGDLVDVVRTDRSFARDFAAHALAQLGDEGRAGIPALVEGLEDPTFRQHAAQALAAFGPAAKAAVPGLVALVRRPTWKEGAEVAARALGRMGPAAREAVPVLVEALSSRDEGFVAAALHALGDLGPAAREAASAVVRHVESENGVVRAAALRARHRLTGEGDREARVALLALLASDDAEARAAAAYALGDVAGASEDVLTALAARERGDGVAAVRRAAAAARARLEAR